METVIMSDDPPGAPQPGNVSLQTWLPGQEHYDEVVRRNSDPSARWALVTLGPDDEPDDQGSILVTLG